MSKAAVRSNLTLFGDDIDATHAQGFTYVLGFVSHPSEDSIICKLIPNFSETGSIACHGAPGVSNTAGAALWVIDYTLQAATLGMKEVYFHEGVGFKYNFVSTFSLPCPHNVYALLGRIISPRSNLSASTAPLSMGLL